MTFFSKLAGLYPAWYQRRFGASERAAINARAAALQSFQRLLKSGGNRSPKPTLTTAAEPTRDTQDGPSTNPSGNEASSEGPALHSKRSPPL
jgi:hypothetical protein